MSTSPAFYCIPRERLDGRSAEMAFADAIYCLAALQSRPFPDKTPGMHALDVNFGEVSKLSGLDEGTVNIEADLGASGGGLKRCGIGGRA